MTTSGEPAKRVMILGAGSTGRGHIGELAFSAGWDLVLVDRDAALVAALRQAGRYSVRLCMADGSRVVNVDRCVAYHAHETEALVAEGLRVPLILTALFSQNLPQIAPLIARIISARCAAGVDAPLNVICCENMQDSSSVLKSLVLPLLTEAEREYACGRGFQPRPVGPGSPSHSVPAGLSRPPPVGFPDCMVSRVVPVAVGGALDLVAEDYNEWTVDAEAFVGPPLDLPAMELVTDQATRLARKFFMHNGAHAVCGYWGFHRGHQYIHEAIADPFVRDHVLAAIDELAAVVARRYALDLESVRAYGLSLGARGAVAEIKDLILRVVRDPLRKLSRPERFTAPAELAVEYGLPCDEIVRAMAAALRYHHPDDAQSLAMQGQIASDGARAAIANIVGLPAEHPLVGRVVAAYEGWCAPTAV